MIYEDYLHCSGYEGQAEHGTEAGFSAFQDETQRYFFSLLDADGKVLLKSEGYPQQAARENGIQSVIKNRGNRDFYSVKSYENGRFYVSLRAANYREIARSCSAETEAEALTLLPYLTGEQVRGGVVAAAAVAAPKERADNKIDDDYMICREYAGHPNIDDNGMVKFTHSNGKHFFAWYDEDGGHVVMRSEGYPTTAARDNGMASVLKNREDEGKYSITERMGRYFVILKAGNHQEIARSCPYESEAAAMAIYPTQRTRAAYVSKSETESAPVEAIVAPVEEVSTPIVEAVEPVVEAPVVETIAPIAAVVTTAAFLETTNSEPVTTSITHIAPEAPSTSTIIDAPADVEDDYLPCREYEGRNINDKANNVALFKHDNGQYYFAVYNTDGSVRLRSEGFRTAQERDVELSGVMKNLNNTEMYSIIRRGDYFINVLKDKTGREVGRSCLQKDAPPPPPAPEPIVEAIAPVAAVAAVAAVATPSIVAPVDVEDDYLPCKDYEGHNINDKANNVALFKHSNGQYYFALYDADGKVRLRSEGFRTAQDRDKELSGALKNLYNQDMYSTIRKGEYFISILKDKTGREVGRSCLQKDEPKPVVAPVIAAPVAAIAVAAVAAAIPKPEPKVEVPVAKVEVPKVAAPVYEAAAPVVEEVATGGFQWWWLLLPLLGLLAWWFFGKGCNKPEASTPAVTTAPLPPVVVDTVKSVTAPAPAVAESCDLNWIFFDFNKADLRSASQTELEQMAAILKKNPDYVAVLSAHTDSKGSDAYNDALSGRRATNAKQYLISKGIAAARIKTTMNGEKDPIAKNEVGSKDTEQGRQYNRRVELYIQDKDGKNVCTSIPPAVATELKPGT
jgi:outer membrane protein OmpA-like peptidoglycan-associated protein/uncharacterized protein YegP (UPF0339 family)